MTLPLVSAVAGRLVGHRVAGVGVLLLFVAVLGLGTAQADDQQDPFSATVKVDATADSAAAARTIARTDGERRALEAVVERLTGSTDLSKLPKLDDQAITDMVVSFEVANEKMSTVRYLADYTFHFRPSGVRRLLRSSGMAFSEHPEKPVVVVPVYRDGDALTLWDDPNPWREAWSAAPPASGPMKFALPLGGITDLTAIDAQQALSGDQQALSDVAEQNGADQAVVAVATAERQDGRLAALDVSAKRYRLGQLVASRSDSVKINPGETDGDFFQRAVGVVIGDLEHGPPPAATATEASLTVTIPITSLGDWVALQHTLVAVPGIHRIDLLSLSRQQARVEITYAGNPDQLKSSLAQANLDLAGGDPDWRLMPAGAPNPN